MKNFLRNWKYCLLTAASVLLMVGNGSTANAKGAPVRLQKFDLVCPLRGRVVADPHPSYVGTYPANVKRWSYRTRFILDLSARRYCDTDCTTAGIYGIPSITNAEIVLDDSHNHRAAIRRKDNYYHQTDLDDEKVSITVGRCRIEKFSGIPPLIP